MTTGRQSDQRRPGARTISPLTVLLGVAALAVLVLAAAAAAGRLGGGDEAAIEVSDAWARPTPPGIEVAAVYLTIRAADGDQLIGVRVDPGVATAASLHRNVTDQAGRSSMEPITELELPAGETVELAPAGELHLMLEAVATPLVEGDQLELTLDFRNAADVTVEVAVTTAVS